MKFFPTINNVTFTVLLTVVIAMYTMKAVSADRMVRYIFNGGAAPTSTTYCSATDYAKISAIFGANAVTNRHERDLSLFTSNETIPTKSDDRQLYRAYCRNNCAGFVAKTCLATGCEGYRRDRELGSFSNVEDDRNLQVSCSTQMASITNALNALITNNQVSSTCKTYLAANKRSTACYDDVIYGEILAAKFWDASVYPPRILTSAMPQYGYSFCASKQFAITSVNHPCVDTMTFELYGPNGYEHIMNQYEETYAIFSDDAHIPRGRQLAPGTYYMWMVPDYQYEKERYYEFTLKNC